MCTVHMNTPASAPCFPAVECELKAGAAGVRGGGLKHILRPAVPLPLGREGPDAPSGIRALSERTQIASRGERRDKDSGNYRLLTIPSMGVTEMVTVACI